MNYYHVEIPLNILPSLILEAERQELGINAGFMDRVVQVYEGCVFMDLKKEMIQSQGHGLYDELDPSLLPPLYLAYKPIVLCCWKRKDFYDNTTGWLEDPISSFQ
jgi:glucuronokinase